jgi:hypothetical protein
MRALLPICAGVAVITGVVSATLWVELRDERVANEQLRTQLSEARSARNVAAAMPVTVAATVAPTPTATPATEAPNCKPETPAAKPAQVANVAALSSFQSSQALEKDLMKDPEYRKLRLAQQRANTERNYPGLAEAMGLSEKEADKLYDLLTEQQMAMSAETALVISNNGTVDQAAMQEATRKRQVLQREQEEALRAELGSRYSQYQDYQQTRPARQQVMSMGTQLAQAGVPLTDTQSRALTTAMIAEQQRQRQSAQLTARPVGLNPADPEYRTKMLDDQLRRQEENNRRTIEAVSPHMNAKQVAALREQMEQSAASLRISMRMQIERERVQAQTQQK